MSKNQIEKMIKSLDTRIPKAKPYAIDALKKTRDLYVKRLEQLYPEKENGKSEKAAIWAGTKNRNKTKIGEVTE
jgi:hypothetical protein